MNRFKLFPQRESSLWNTGRIQWLAVFVFLFALQESVSSCGGPTVTVENKTSFPVRAVVSQSGANSALSPSPGENSSADADVGAYTVTVIPDADWVNYAKTKRKVLNDALANSENLSGQQLLAVVQQLKEIAAQMQAIEQSAGKGASCSGTVSENHDGLASISQAADGSLVVACK
jgi:hypothetical protein